MPCLSNLSTRARLLVLGATTAALLAVGGTVAATNFGPIGNCGDGFCCVCYANGPRHKTSYHLNTQFRRAFNYVRENVYNPTDVQVVKAAHGRDDVAAYTNNYGASGWYGIVDCVDYRNKRVCDHWHLHINTHYGPYSRKFARALACHELGHTLGLQHTESNETCMKRIMNSSTPPRLRRHDRRHLNRRY